MTEDNTLEYHLRRRILRLAKAFVEGPRSLIPPEELDDFGWLEPELKLRWWHNGYRAWESLIIYCDNTVNRDEHFLKPLIRYARWERQKDMRQMPAWPTVDIRLSYFEEHLDWVNAKVKLLQDALAHAPFVAFGLTLQRDAPDMQLDGARGTISIYSRNGIQAIEYTSDALPPGDKVTELFFDTFQDLLNIMQPISREGWKEAYDYDWSDTDVRKSWYWDGKVPIEAPGG